MTETAVVVSSSSEHDVMNRSSGSLLPGIKVKLLDSEGNEITEYEKSGEILVQSPSAVLGYLNNQKATTETFTYDNDGRWVRTGDEGLITKAVSGYEHLVIVDRIKELIKVNVSQIQYFFQIGNSIFIGPPSRSGRTRSTYPRPSCSR